MLTWLLATALGERVMLDLPARYMWGWAPPSQEDATGFCGSMSIQTSALYYGNYLTQAAPRVVTGGSEGPESMILLTGKDESGFCCGALKACRRLGLNATAFDTFGGTQSTPQYEAYLDWARAAIRKGNPVIITVYMNTLSDRDYDHIIPMVGFDTEGDGAIYFNDLYYNQTYRRNITDDFIASSNRKKGCQFSGKDEWNYCIPEKYDYGIQVHGNHDPNAELLPARLKMEKNWEPDYSQEDEVFAKPVTLKATISAWDLEEGETYALLRFDDSTMLPDGDFYANRGDAAEVVEFQAGSSGRWSQEVEFMSDSTQFFRVVRARVRTQNNAPRKGREQRDSSPEMILIASGATVAGIVFLAGLFCFVRYCILRKNYVEMK